MPETTKDIAKLNTGETVEEIRNFLLKYIDSVVEFDENSKLIAKNIIANGGKVETDYIQLNTAIANAPTTVGAIYWDDQDKTFTGVMEPANGDSPKLQIGQEMYIRAVNKTGTTISNGQVVFVDGAQGNRPSIALADADNYSDSVKTIGLATEDIPNNLYGYVTTEGLVRDLNTSDYTAGECVYLSQTAGSYTTVTPSFGTSRVRVGMIVKSHPTDGWVCVHVSEDKYMFGDVDNGNYTGFEDDGTIKFVGNATVWRDENAGGIALTRAAANRPDLTTINGTNILTYAFDGGGSLEELHWGTEIQHDYKEGTDIWPHIHFYPTTDAVGDIKFTLEYYIKSRGVATVQGTTSFVTSSGGTAWEEIRIDFDDVIDGTNLTIADQAHFRIFRDSSDAQDGYTNDVAIATVGYHYEVDTVGSRQITTKG